MNHSKITALEKKILAEYSNTAGIIVQKDGHHVYESYFNHCNADSHMHVFSVTKSILSILIGIAIDKGLIKSPREKVFDFFPEYTLNSHNESMRHITLAHLMTMTVPYQYGTSPDADPYPAYFSSSSWVKASLDLLGGDGQIGDFRYSPLIGPDILSGILTKATGQSVLDFASAHLFAPLEISVKDSIIFGSLEEQLAFYEGPVKSGWVADSNGVNTAGWGLTLTLPDMAKMGQLYLNEGRWNDHQIVSEQWVKGSTAEHSRWKEMDLPYGYLWWLTQNGFAAVGDGGNVIYVNVQNKIVVAMNGFFVPNASDPIEFIQNHIEPLFDTTS